MSFCFAPFCSKKRKGCFSKQTKVKTHFLRRSEKSQKWKWKRWWKNHFWDLFKKPERNSEKQIYKIGTGEKEKKRNPKGEEKLKVFYRKRWRKEVKKDTKKKHEWRSCKKISKKGEKRYFLRKRCLATKK